MTPHDSSDLVQTLWEWLRLLLAIPLSYLVGSLLAGVLLRILGRIAARTQVAWDDRLIEALQRPGRAFLGLLVLYPIVTFLHPPPAADAAIHKFLQVAMIGAAAWLAVSLLRFLTSEMEERAVQRAADKGVDEPGVRGLRTQLHVLKRVAAVVIWTVAAALMLLQIEIVRSVGVSLLASAGIAGVVIGLAAQRSIATLLAGIQISLTQPIRIGDTVIVEGEWGWIEEISLTYVVVKVWDERRLVVPINRFFEHAFQNWTKVSPELLGTVEIFADHTLPVGEVRAALDRILEDNPRWDRRSKGVQVTDVTERCIKVRALMSAADAGKLWDLRCDVREQLVAWLRDLAGGAHLPRTRVSEVGRGATEGTEGAEGAESERPARGASLAAG